MWSQICAVSRSRQGYFGFFSLFGASLEFAGKLTKVHAAFLKKEGCVCLDGALYIHPSIGWEPPAECLQLRATLEIEARLAEVQRGKDLLFTLVREPGVSHVETLVKELDDRLAEEISAFYTSMEFEAPRSTPRVDTDIVIDLLRELRNDYLPNIIRGGEKLHQPVLVVRQEDPVVRRLLRVIRCE